MDDLNEYLNAKRGRRKELAEVLGISPSAVTMWPRVPAERVLVVEVHTGISRHVLRPDLYGPLSQFPTTPPAGDDVGASITPPAEVGAPTVCQGRAEVARLAHNQEVAGSNPAPATNFVSPATPPAGEAGAQCSAISCAPASFSGEAAK